MQKLVGKWWVSWTQANRHRVHSWQKKPHGHNEARKQLPSQTAGAEHRTALMLRGQASVLPHTESSFELAGRQLRAR